MSFGWQNPLHYGFGLGGWFPRSLDPTARLLRVEDSLDGDRYWMAQALLAAMDGHGRALPNPCVGAVLIKDNRLLAQGATLRYGDLHAERVALQLLDPAAAQGASCYVTLEPCAHHGKQPPCTASLIQAGIRRCIVATEDSHPQVAGRGIAQLRGAGIEVEVGCLRGEARAWHFPFLAFQQLRQQRPVLIGKWAQTLDGHLADDQGRSQWISGPRSRAYGHWLRQKYDGIMVGIGTVFADLPSLTVREAPLPRHRQPHKIIYDPFGRLAQAGPEIFAALRRELREEGPHLYWLVQEGSWKPLEAWPEGEAFTVPVLLRPEENWESTIQRLAAAYLQRCGVPLQSIMVEGGTQLLTQLLRSQLLDAWHVFVRTGILGGQRHRIGQLAVRAGEDPSLINPSRALMDRDDFRLVDSMQLEDDIVLECAHRRYDFWPASLPTA